MSQVQRRSGARGLGRGLESLIPLPSRSEAGSVRMIAVDHVRPASRQPRRHFRSDALRELADSIREHGLLQPVLVRDVGNGWELIAGERRWRAAKLAGLDRIPAVVRTEEDETRRLILALVENLQREDLDPLEEARALERLNQMGLTHQDIAERLGRNRVSVTQSLRLLDACPAVTAAVESGALSAGHARALIGLPSREAQEHGLRVVLGKRLNVRQTEAWVRSYRPVVRRGSQTKDSTLAQLGLDLEAALGLTGSITGGPSGGRISIRFSNRKELEDLLVRLRP
jgi:ParB family chromosome partitioning protein